VGPRAHLEKRFFPLPLDGTSLDSSLMGAVDLSAMQILAVEPGTVSEVSISNLCTLLQVV